MVDEKEAEDLSGESRIFLIFRSNPSFETGSWFCWISKARQKNGWVLDVSFEQWRWSRAVLMLESSMISSEVFVTSCGLDQLEGLFSSTVVLEMVLKSEGHLR